MLAWGGAPRLIAPDVGSAGRAAGTEDGQRSGWRAGHATNPARGGRTVVAREAAVSGSGAIVDAIEVGSRDWSAVDEGRIGVRGAVGW